MPQTRRVMIDKLREPDALQVRHVGSEMRRHRLKRSSLLMTPMQIFCHFQEQPAASLDAPPALRQKGYNITLCGGALTQCR
jgi:hypothetical protein